jgi:hypothetical protein
VARILDNLEAEIVLFCAHEDKARHDYTIGQGVEKQLQACVRVPFSPITWVDFFRRRARFVGMPLLGQIPDIYRSWGKTAVKAINRFVQQKKYRPDILISFGQPWTDHLVGLALKRRWGWPWIAHFSDPWVANPYQQSDRLTKWINQRLERQVLSLADKMIFTTEETVELVIASYPSAWRAKVRVLPHAFDPRVYPTVQPNSNSREKKTFRYLGNFYGPRTPEPLFQALNLIQEREPELLNGICFELVGHCPSSMLRGIYRQLPKGLISLRPPVTYAESLNLMRTADALLLIDAPADLSVFLPSKLIEYIGAARPILGIVPPGSSATLIRRLGGWAADPKYPEEVEAMLVNYLTLPLFPSDWGEPSVRKEYEISQVVEKINKMISDMVEKK